MQKNALKWMNKIGAIALAFMAGYVTYQFKIVGVISAAREAHTNTRLAVIRSQSAQLGGAPRVIVFGDSIVELAYFDFGCESVVNAGISGATLSKVSGVAERIVSEYKPNSIVIAVGVNDAMLGLVDGFEEKYRQLIRAMKARGVSVKIATIAPIVDESFAHPIRQLNGEIIHLTETESVGLVDFRKMADGVLPKELTSDGVHLNAGGYVTWKGILFGAICGA